MRTDERHSSQLICPAMRGECMVEATVLDGERSRIQGLAKTRTIRKLCSGWVKVPQHNPSSRVRRFDVIHLLPARAAKRVINVLAGVVGPQLPNKEVDKFIFFQAGGYVFRNYVFDKQLSCKHVKRAVQMRFRRAVLN